MANWSDLKSSVSSIIKTNGNNEITGQMLQNVLKNMISNLGANLSFAGVATPGTNPGTPDGNVFYLAAQEGTYSNFGQTVGTGEIAVFSWKGTSWKKDVILDSETISKALKDGSVTTSKIVNGAVTTEKIANEAVTAQKISDGAVTTLKVAEGAITMEKLAEDVQEAIAAGGTGSITDGSVTTDKIADGAVTTNKIAAEAVDKNRLANEAVTTSKIKDKAVSFDKLSSALQMTLEGLQDGKAIQDGAITMSKLAQEVQEAIAAGGSGGTGSIADGSVTRAKLDEQVGGVVDNAEELFAEYETENLVNEVSIVGGYIEGNNTIVNNSIYNSYRIPLEAGETYYVHAQLGAGTYSRILVKSGDGFTQYAKFEDPVYAYTTPTDGQEYYLQVVRATKLYNGNPLPDPDSELWVSKGRPLYTYIPPKTKLNIPELTRPKEAKYEGSINILAIGNSYSRDALSYVPFLLADMIPEIEVTIGILYKGSCTLAQHYNLINANDSYEEFDLFTSKNGRWVTTNQNATIDYVLRNTVPWNIITLQQQSNASRDYSTYQPYLNDIINLLQKKVQVQNTPVKIGWILTPAYADGSSSLGSDTSDSMFTKICEAVKSVMDNTAVEFFWPCGTAVQNARTTSLKDLGATGGLMADGLHLQEGIPCMLEAYVAASRICDMVGKSHKGNILGNSVSAGSKIVNPIWNVPQQNGKVVGTADDKRLAQKCSIMALKKPLEITTIDF